MDRLTEYFDLFFFGFGAWLIFADFSFQSLEVEGALHFEKSDKNGPK